jgi:hypothetical protein
MMMAHGKGLGTKGPLFYFSTISRSSSGWNEEAVKSLSETVNVQSYVTRYLLNTNTGQKDQQ